MMIRTFLFALLTLVLFLGCGYESPYKGLKPEPLYKEIEGRTVEDAERDIFNLINEKRIEHGLQPTVWDDELYELSKQHTNEMAEEDLVFHSSTDFLSGENAASHYLKPTHLELVADTVDRWMDSSLHRRWILHPGFTKSAVSVVRKHPTTATYVSWSFWRSEK